MPLHFFGVLAISAAALIGTLGSPGVLAASPNDTGQAQCFNASDVAVPCSAAVGGDAGVNPRQDGRYGRDPAAAAGQLGKTGAGSAGFDYTKIANNGNVLLANAALGSGLTDWACTRDNVTKLVWEVKTPPVPSGLRSGHTYSWYSTDDTKNGGSAGRGSVGVDTCNGTLFNYGNKCNTQNYVAAVNAAGLCGKTDWRLPERNELLTLVHSGQISPATIDPTYFPNTAPVFYWSRNTAVGAVGNAWSVNFGDGIFGPASSSTSGKGSTFLVRLVRTGP